MIDSGVLNRSFARVLAGLHIMFALFVVFGAVAVVRWRPLLWLHLIAILWAAATLSFDLGCPLTIWEKSFSRRGGVEPYPEGFLAHYLGRPDLTPNQSRVFHIALGAGAVALNVAVYAFFII